MSISDVDLRTGDIRILPRTCETSLPAAFRQYIESCVGGTSLEGLCVTLLRRRNDSVTLRLATSNQLTVILKCWRRSGLRGYVRLRTRTSPSWREWLALTRLSRDGVRVSRPLYRFSCPTTRDSFSECLVVEDLGVAPTVQEVLHRASAEARQDELDRMECLLIQMTHALLASSIVDPDHSVVNMLYRPDGYPYRIDFEVAQLSPSKFARGRLYAQMIARLVTSFVYSVQPDVPRARRFADNLADYLKPEPRVLRTAKLLIDTALDRQRIATGINSSFQNAW